MQQETLRTVNLRFAMPLLSLCLCFTTLAASAADSFPNKTGAFDSINTSSGSTSSFLAGGLLPDDCEEDNYAALMTHPATPATNMDQEGIMLAAAQRPSKARSGASTKAEAEQHAAEAAPPTPPVPPTPVWEITPSDGTLNSVLARWSAQAGWQLAWELPVDYSVQARTAIPGTFEEAVETVAKSMDTAEIPLKAIFYKGNKVLRIVPKGIEQ